MAKAKAPGAGRDQVLEAGLDFRFGRTGGRYPGRISDQILPLTNVGVVDNDNCAMERRLIPAPLRAGKSSRLTGQTRAMPLL